MLRGVPAEKCVGVRERRNREGVRGPHQWRRALSLHLIARRHGDRGGRL